MFRRAVVTVAGSVLALVVLSAPAWAHVTANPSELPAGGFSVITFRVPTESDTASTTELEVQFPADAPFGFVSVKPTPGWTHTEETSKLAKPITTDDGEVSEYTSRVTWAGGKIAPGEFQEFQVSVGPVPEVHKLVFKAVQTYDNGDVVRWIDEATGNDEPEHPAPTITVTKASDAADATAPVASSDVNKDDVDSAKTLAIVGTIAGVVGLLVAVAALVTSRRRT